MRKWDERRLAFEIDNQKRGTYILAYFAADPVHLVNIERGFNLSERVTRLLITRADHLSIEEMQAADGQRELADEAELRRARAEAAPAAGTPGSQGAATVRFANTPAEPEAEADSEVESEASV
jgi:small subunit ribosomal protein S6